MALKRPRWPMGRIVTLQFDSKILRASIPKLLGDPHRRALTADVLAAVGVLPAAVVVALSPLDPQPAASPAVRVRTTSVQGVGIVRSSVSSDEESVAGGRSRFTHDG